METAGTGIIAAYHAKGIIGNVASICLSQPDDLVGHVAIDPLQVAAEGPDGYCHCHTVTAGCGQDQQATEPMQAQRFPDWL